MGINMDLELRGKVVYMQLKFGIVWVQRALEAMGKCVAAQRDTFSRCLCVLRTTNLRSINPHGEK